MYATYKTTDAILQRTFIGAASPNDQFRNPVTPLTSLKPTYVGLLLAGSTLDQMRAGTYTEVVGGTYGRQAVTWAIPTLGAVTASVGLAAPYPQFTKGAAENWGTIKYIGLFNANAAGDLLWFVEINPTINMTNAGSFVNTLSFPTASSMMLSFPGAALTTGAGFGKRFSTILLNSIVNWAGAGTNYWDDSLYWNANTDCGDPPPYVDNTKMLMAHLALSYTPGQDSGGDNPYSNGLGNDPGLLNYDYDAVPAAWATNNGPKHITFTVDKTSNRYCVKNDIAVTFAAATAPWSFGNTGGLAIVEWYHSPFPAPNGTWKISHLVGWVPLLGVNVAAGQQLTFQPGAIQIFVD